MRKSLILAALICATSFIPAAQAQNVPLPKFLDDQKDLMKFEGTLGGLEIWSMDGLEGVWAVSPDGKMAMAGVIFGQTGKDMGAMLLGREPLTDFEITAEGLGGPAFGGETAAIRAEGGSKTEEKAEAPSPKAKPIPVNLPADIDLTLEGFSETDREVLLQTLIGLLDGVKSEAEFRGVVEAWTAEVARRHLEKTGGGEMKTAVEPVLAEDSSVDILDPQIRPAAEPSADEAQAAPEAGTQAASNEPDEAAADKLLKDVREGSFWFSIGGTDAPAVYAFLDPTCPFCARAMNNIRPEIESGKLQLRVLMTPVISQASPGVATAILQSENPVKAFWENILLKAEGQPFNLPAGDIETLDPAFRQGMDRNVNLMVKYGIRGVPFFVFDTNEGALVLNGVPSSAAVFSDAVVDGYTGDQTKAQ